MSNTNTRTANITYSSFVESLKRLYQSSRVSDTQIKNLLDTEKITAEEYLYILGKDGDE